MAKGSAGLMHVDDLMIVAGVVLLTFGEWLFGIGLIVAGGALHFLSGE